MRPREARTSLGTCARARSEAPLVPRRLASSSGMTRMIVSGNTARTSPTSIVPLWQMIVSVAAWRSLRISASSQMIVTGGLSSVALKVKVGRTSFALRPA